MFEVYQDTDLRSGYLHVLQQRKAKTADSIDTEVAYLQTVLDAVVRSLVEAGQHFPEQWTMPQLKRYPPAHSINSEALFADQQGYIHVGLGILLKLNEGVMRYTNFLLANYLTQISPAANVAAPLTAFVSVDDFPSEALHFYAANFFPEAIAKDGYEKGAFQSSMEGIKSVRAVEHGQPFAVLTRHHAWELLDVRDYAQEAIENILDKYLDESFSLYCLRLHLQLLLDALHFILAHEAAHILLGHVQSTPNNTSQLRREEAEADSKALQLLRAIPDFNLRSLFTLFAFVQSVEPDVSPTDLTHPFSRDRVLLLCHAALATEEGETLHTDVNAGMAMLARPLSPLHFLYRWDDGHEEEIVVSLSSYSDLDYTAYLLLFVERSPYRVEVWNGHEENAQILVSLTLELHVALRDRVQPDTVFHRGTVLLRPGKPQGSKGYMGSYTVGREPAENRVLSRWSIPVAAPPEWWLNNPDSVLEVEVVKRAPEALHLTENAAGMMMQYQFEQVEFVYQDYLNSLLTSSQKAATRSTILTAARRFHTEKRLALSVLFYEWLYTSTGHDLLYPDLINLCFDLVQLGRLHDAADIAAMALSAGRPMRPGFHLLIANDCLSRNLLQEAMEHNFYELFGIGEYGEYHKEAESQLQALIRRNGDPVIALMRRYFRISGSAHLSAESGHIRKALKGFRKAHKYLVKARQKSRQDFIFLRQYSAETLTQICRLGNQDFGPAKQAFEAIRQLDPQFVPATMQLAGIAVAENDIPRAKELWAQANKLMPFNHFVFDASEIQWEGVPVTYPIARRAMSVEASIEEQMSEPRDRQIQSLIEEEYRREYDLGEDELRMGDIRAAINRYFSLLERIERLYAEYNLDKGDYGDAKLRMHCEILMQLAVCLSEGGKFDDAIAHLRKAQRIIEADPFSPLIKKRVEVLYHLATILLKQGKYSEEQKVVEEIVQIAKRAGAYQAEALESLDNLEQGVLRATLTDAVFAEQEGNLAYQATALEALGQLEQIHGNNAKAREYLTEALKITQKLGERNNEAHFWYALGNLAFQMKEWPEAEQCWRESLVIHEQLDDAGSVIIDCKALGTFAEMSGRSEEAERWFKRVLELKKQMHPEALDSEDYINLARVLLNEVRAGRAPLNRLAEAREYTEQAIKVLEKLEITVDTWKAMEFLAEIARLEGRLREARDYRNRAHETFAALASERIKIDKQHRHFIADIAAAAKGNSKAKTRVEADFPVAEANGWKVTDATQRIWKGECDWPSLTEDLNATSALLILRVLETLAQNRTEEQILDSLPSAIREAIEQENRVALEQGFQALSLEDQQKVREAFTYLLALQQETEGR